MESPTPQMSERRERILTAAREIIGEKGFEALTMRDLARRSHVTVPTLYNLIGGKDAVLFAAVEEQTGRFVRSLAVEERADDDDRVLRVVDACVSELLRMPRYYRSLLRLLFSSDAAGPVRAEVARALHHELRQGLRVLADQDALLGWVDLDAVAARLQSHLNFTALAWASGDLDGRELRAAASYEACLLLLGISEGRPRKAFERRARALQEDLGRRPRAGHPRRAGGRRP